MSLGHDSFIVWALLVLAVYRITIFFVFDSLMGFNPTSGSKASALLDNFAYTEGGSDRSFVRGKIGDLLTCPWCLGFHIAWVILCLWLMVWPWQLGVHGWIEAFAVAGGAVFMTDHSNVGKPPTMQLLPPPKE